MEKKKKPWGGRFSLPTDKLVEVFTASIPYDQRLYAYDIEGSTAHCKMLVKQGILSKAEGKKIISGLDSIRKDIEKGRFEFSIELEDIHMAIERALIACIGEAGEKLHTGRSRNDQVALDIRMYLRDEISKIMGLVVVLKSALLKLAKAEIDTVMPGYTHLQKAQPILLSHYFLAYWEMLDRDGERLDDCLKRVNVMPLGAAALAGTSLPLDRRYTAELLGFPKITANSMDSVSDRDFIAETIWGCSLIMMHLSRFCEDMILWSSNEFGFIEISDAYTTGSSIMPQKKNPDVAELVRGKTGRVYGDLIAILTIMKGLPMSYNRDMQEDKEALFDAIDTVKGSLAIIGGMIGNIRFDRQRMLDEASKGFSTATDLAEYLVKKGIPFRKAHEVVGRIVGDCIKMGTDLEKLDLAFFRNYAVEFEADVLGILDVRQSVNSRNIEGGTGQKSVLKRIKEIEKSGK
jgi:argininosuccinate lyase